MLNSIINFFKKKEIRIHNSGFVAVYKADSLPKNWRPGRQGTIINSDTGKIWDVKNKRDFEI